jgi:hypothetical protein
MSVKDEIVSYER